MRVDFLCGPPVYCDQILCRAGRGGMISRIRTFISKNQMIRPKDKILAGISGGPDSVCLLFVLQMLQKELDFQLMAVHVNHGLRGQEADRDQAFVEKLCREQEIPLRCVSMEVRERARREKLTLEEAGRLCRYEVFAQEAQRYGCNRIAVAHHGDDQAETMLFHLFRGTGLRGLAGMEPKRDRLIRPLLCVERREILEWLREQGLSWCEDSTNQQEAYTRNRIRHSILICAREQINDGAVRHMMGTAEELAEIEHFLEESTQRAARLCVREERNGCFIFEEAFDQLPSLLKGRLVRFCLAEQGDGLKDIERQHIEMVKELFGKHTGSWLCLPGGRRALREYGGVALTREEPGEQQDMGALPLVEIPGSCRTGEKTWIFSLENAQKNQIIPEKTYTKWFDYDKIENYPVIRRRMPGDYLEINREHGRKKLKDYLIDQKVPVRERGRLLLLADGSHIIWIPGMRISEGYKVTEDTRRILKVQIYGGEEDGREDPSDDSGG